MFDVYGDESCGREYVAYGLLVVQEHQLAATEGLLARIKTQFGGTTRDRLHCRELFAPHARAKGPWAALSLDDVFALYEALLAGLAEFKLRRIVAVARKSDFPKELPALAMQHIDPAANVPPIHTRPFPVGDKQLSIWCANSAMIPLAHSPGLDRVRIWLDPDSTVVDWFTGRHAVKNEVGNFFVDMGAGVEPPKVNVSPVDVSNKPSMLEVADVIAYTAQRGKAAKYSRNDLRFKELMRLIDAERIVFGIAPNGGFGANIPDATMNYRSK